MQSPKRDQARVNARVTNDVAATPRATLKDGLVQHQWGVGLGSRMPPRFYGRYRSAAARHPRVSGPMCRDTSRAPLKTDTTYGTCGSPVGPAIHPSRLR
jgi:hypothetical protein